MTKHFDSFEKAKKFVRRANKLNYVAFINNPYAFQAVYIVKVVARNF